MNKPHTNASSRLQVLEDEVNREFREFQRDPTSVQDEERVKKLQKSITRLRKILKGVLANRALNNWSTGSIAALEFDAHKASFHIKKYVESPTPKDKTAKESLKRKNLEESDVDDGITKTTDVQQPTHEISETVDGNEHWIMYEKKQDPEKRKRGASYISRVLDVKKSGGDSTVWCITKPLLLSPTTQ
ncbi:hypothetical protein QAD02_002822 [Eretmocerus hayati]|uniref:Uncharacterized protein n=1 Tax=Eretmocerus hayati TaxID=131215 RepID=A0ACC2NKZ1_9HYME|nr:hypothetical protein QAD02_002822 [Eretmocerus hayati]